MTTSLQSTLDYQPVCLKFGTSGRRGRVVDLTQLEVYLNALAEVEYLQSLPLSQGGVAPGDEFFFACDLRPSSSQFDGAQQGRGEIAQAIARALAEAGMWPVYLGQIPTPALSAFALERRKGSMMVTGSHIPFDRNGYKTNTSRGELLKRDEAPIQARVDQVRQRVYSQPWVESPFDRRGMFKSGHSELPATNPAAFESFLRRYTDFFPAAGLKGRRFLVYQHSAVGRDLLVELLRRFEAEVVPAGRSETFVPIDTENIESAQLAAIQALADDAWQTHGPLDAVVSTDGDSDRPLLLGLEPEGKGCRVRFFGGDLIGMIVAEFLGADAVVVPISCNDAVDHGALKNVVAPKTRIGSPFVIEGMQSALAQGCKAVCGWEANGGFLTATEFKREGRVLKPLPTRDAFLPLLAVLFRAVEAQTSLCVLFDRLPPRFSRAALLKNFPRPASLSLVRLFSPADNRVRELLFKGGEGLALAAGGGQVEVAPGEALRFNELAAGLEGFFSRDLGFSRIAGINYTDGVRIYFADGEIAHIRPSGNADELRIYAVASSPERAERMVQLGVAEPAGILRRMEAATSEALQQEAIEDFLRRPRLVKLQGAVQHYDWGGRQFIAGLLGQPQPSAQPCAELWMGTHANGPSAALLDAAEVPLSGLIAAAPRQTLGETVAARYHGRLPYLFKILDARKMLSIQAHPTLVQAAAGFEREEAAAIDLSAPTRNYKDRNHKPEVHVALTEFWMLHGFRPPAEIAATFAVVPELSALLPDFAVRLAGARDSSAQAGLLRQLYETAMTLPQAAIDEILNPLLARLEIGPPPSKDTADYWALRAARDFPLPGGHRDRGILSVYFLNLIRLEPGEATYQPAGTLHAYLEGVNVELMANSDNVLRGGLTPKRVDVPELLRILRFEGEAPRILSGREVSEVERVYSTPAAEFQLSRVRLAASHSFVRDPSAGPEIWIQLAGEARVQAGPQRLELGRGGIFFAPAGVGFTLTSGDEESVLFRAAVPMESSLGAEPK